jgi:hypothetical protein
MKIKTRRNIALFDVDGVVVANPEVALNKTINDFNFWENHWNDVDGAVINTEVTELAQSLISTNWQVIFLTARPIKFRAQTERLLSKAGMFVAPVTGTLLPLEWERTNAPLLVMYPSNSLLSSAAWKQEQVKEWVDDGLKVRFMMEDYRPNAEAVRALVPVFLYERKKISQHSAALGAYLCCGGVAACWCPADATETVSV